MEKQNLKKQNKIFFASSALISLMMFPDFTLALDGPIRNTNIPKMTYGRFLEYIDMGWIKKVDFYENNKLAVVEASSPELGDRPQRIKVELPTGTSPLVNKLKNEKIDFTSHKNDVSKRRNPLLGLIFPIIIVFVILSLFRRSNRLMGGPGQLMNFRNSKAKVQMNPETGTRFSDVAGIDEAKQELEEIVTFLKTPERFTAVGAKIPRGILLVGPPGTGKTLLAKAIAGEAGVPFISMAGSEFVEMFVGVGASRVRDLFQRAKQCAPCIVFIDEIDAVGRQRGTGVGGANDEREQTLNQLLTEMDGFQGNTGVIVIAATNRPDILDSALLRPGRFDRQVTVNPPDKQGRIEILKVHARNKKLSTNLSLESIAQRTPGFSGADLANLLNEAAILTARFGKSEITLDEINIAVDRIIAGLEGRTLSDGKNKRLLAYHEVGHALVGTLMPYHEDVEKVTLVPRGQARGLTWFTPQDSDGLISRNQIMARIVTALGGRAAEEVVFGAAEVTTGASSDIRQVTSMARQMVARYGMSGLGPLALDSSTGQQPFLGGGRRGTNQYSEEVANKIDMYVKEIVDTCYKEAIRLVKENRVIMDRIVEILVQKETIDGNEFRSLLSLYTDLPVPKEYKSRLQTSQFN